MTAVVVSIVVDLGLLLLVINQAGLMRSAFADLGGAMPLSTRAVTALGRPGLAVVFGALNIATFVVAYRLAARYWRGLLFVPPFVAFGCAGAALTALALPLSHIISLIK